VTYFLDTNVISALMRPDAAVADRLAQVAPSDVWLPQPAIAEIAYGIAALPASKRRRWLEERRTLVVSGIQHAEWTDEVSSTFGQIKAALEKRGDRIEDLDIAIAAHAVAAGGVLVTADRRHMPRISGLIVEDWSQVR
jgi:tRNA(fMet)-specific endonuclease VapC